MYPKIVIVGTRQLSLLASKVMEYLKLPKWIKLEISEQTIESLLEGDHLQLEQKQYEPATIIISGEQSSKTIEEWLKTIVIPVKIKESDILVPLMKSAPDEHIAIINYRTRFKNIDCIAKELHPNISQYNFTSLKEIHDVFKDLHEKNTRKVIGGSYACEIATQYGIESLFLYSENALRDAIETAIKFLKIYRSEMEQSGLFKTVASINKSGIISINENNKITSVNKTGEKLLGLSKETLFGKNIEEWIDEYQLTTNVKDQQPIIFTIGNATFVATLSPVYVAGERFGAILVIDDVKEIQQKELNIRKKINQKSLMAQYHFTDIIGTSESIKYLKKVAKKFSQATVPILIQGESGTGKELFAQSIHNASNRSEASFVAINCAAIPDNLLDSELFGYEDGAFTGAKKGGKKGLFELAHQGTIFLDEINALPLHLQSKLLRVLQEKEVMKIGGNKVIPVDIRVISAANEDLMKLVQNKSFREDLYYRINVLQLTVPPLRERREDIEDIAKHHLAQISLKAESESLLTPSVLSLLYQYQFPGNIRELKNILERFRVYCSGEKLTESTICQFMKQALHPGTSGSFQHSKPFMESLNLKEQEYSLIEAALRKHNGNKDLAAKELGISRATLWRKLKE